MRIKMSERGLTFSFQRSDCFKPGTHYRYIIDNAKKEIILVADENGKYKMSRKGDKEKPLVDLRNKEIKDAMSGCRYMEIEMADDRIIVHLIKLLGNVEGKSDIELAEMIERSESITFSIDKESLIDHDEALTDMLSSAGFFSEMTRKDISYIFDVVSLFSGAGLLDYPFKKDDSFDVRFAVDFDKAACETYRHNIGDHILCMDMRDLKEEDVPECDVVLGGVCCQGYSNANRAGNESLDRSKRLLVDDYIRIVRAKKPLMFVIENVPQFITKENGKYLNKVLEGLSDEYNITYSVVNDLDVGGYSKRKRMILFGSVKAMGKVVIPDVVLAYQKTAGMALKKVDMSWPNYCDVTKPSADTQAKMAQVRPGHNYKDIPGMEQLDRHSNVYRRLSADEPSVTITNWRKVNLMPPIGNRILSVSEAAAIMGLDKKFKFFGSLNDRQQQVGNGVTQAIASFVKAMVKNYLFAFVNRRLRLSQSVA